MEPKPIERCNITPVRGQRKSVKVGEGKHRIIWRGNCVFYPILDIWKRSLEPPKWLCWNISNFPVRFLGEKTTAITNAISLILTSKGDKYGFLSAKIGLVFILQYT